MGALINAACLSAKLGYKDDALDLLERVFARGWGSAGGSNTIRITRACAKSPALRIC